MQLKFGSVSSDSFSEWLDTLTVYEVFPISCFHPHDIITMKQALWELEEKEGKGKSSIKVFSRIWAIYRDNFSDWRTSELRSEIRRKKATKVLSNKKIREWIFKRDLNCLCCGSKKRLTIDHIIPVIKGGEDVLSNFQTLCHSCNSKKGTKYIDFR